MLLCFLLSAVRRPLHISEVNGYNLYKDRKTLQLCSCQSFAKALLCNSTALRNDTGCGCDINNVRKNPLGIQMLSLSLYRQLFGGVTKLTVETNSTSSVQKSIEHLKIHGLWGRQNPTLPDVDFQLPQLKGNDLDSHFRQLAMEQTSEYRTLADKLANCVIPTVPESWVYQAGWTRYSPGGGAEKVDFPLENALVFDVEVLMTEGDMPTLATAVSEVAWYSWCSSRLIEDHISISQRISTDDLIPMETNHCQTKPPDNEWKKRLIVGHNVSYDRARIKEQYYIKGTKLRFLDTMSLHIACSGFTGLQRALFISEETGNKSKLADEAKERARGPPAKQWMKIGSLNNLVDVYKLYCKGLELKKDLRETFLHGTMTEVRKDFQRLMTYCANDVKATHQVFHHLLPVFFQRFPHPVTFAGMLEMSCAYLPVNQNWERYIAECQMTYDDLEKELKIMLMRLANEACQLVHDDRYKNDPWLWDLDWHLKDLKSKKTVGVKNRKRCLKSFDDVKSPVEAILPNKDHAKMGNENDSVIVEDLTANVSCEVQTVINTVENLYVKRPIMAGYPAWYCDLCTKFDSEKEDWIPGPSLLSSQMQITPKLLRMCWDGYPLHYSKKNGWGYLVPGRQHFTSEEKYENFPLDEVRKVSSVFHSDVSSESSQIDLDALWDKILDGVADPAEEAKLWDSLRADKQELKSKTAKRVGTEKSSGTGACEDEEIPGCWFYRLPHKDGPQNRVGNPLAKDFLNKIEDGTLRSSAGEHADYALKLGKMISYWRNANKRITSQMVVWLKKEEFPENVTTAEGYNEDCQYGSILPKIVTAGTVTRRAVEPTWLTASNAYVDRVGSELKAIIQAHPGYHFVGADVDSQELWIAAILGDAHFAGMHGCTAFGWMTLQGKKSNSTDMHSKTASTVGISRDQAKIMNYGRIYGAGQSFASRLLMQFNHRLSQDEAKSRSKTMYALTKGVKGYVLNETGRRLFHSRNPRANSQGLNNSGDLSGNEELVLTRKQLFDLLHDDNNGFEFEDVIQKSVWIGGTESAMFNKLESIAMSPEPKTPVLDCRISRALEALSVMDNFMTSRVNWVVQSSAVDYLHLMLVSMRWLFDTYDIEGRFSISIHDEVRYLVKSEDRYRAALALQITNLLTRALFAFKLGMNDLPQSVAFFSSVDVDTVLRKEVNLDCKTPSNINGLEIGYGIPPGVALDIHTILEKTNGQLIKYKRNE